MEKVQPRYAIPFASNHCHLHKDVYPLNGYVMTPVLVKDYVDSNDVFPNTPAADHGKWRFVGFRKGIRSL